MLDSIHLFIASSYGLITIWLLGVLAGIIILHQLGRFWSTRRGRKFRRRGKRAEKMAAKILKKQGYTILEKEPTIISRLQVNGVDRRFEVTPDFLVTKNGLDYTVEVKSHGSHELINQAHIRRQIVEYIRAAQLPCILLTTRDKVLTHISFPDET